MRRVIARVPYLPDHPGLTLLIIAFGALLSLLGLVTLDRTGRNGLQVAGIATNLAIFVALSLQARSHRRSVLIVFLTLWAALAIAGFTSRTDFLMGSDVHRELRALTYFGAGTHWEPLALSEISYSSVWLVVGTRMLADLSGAGAFALLKYAYPALLAFLAVPTYLVCERVIPADRAFGATFLAVSLLSFWAGTAQIAKASLSMLLTLTLVYVLIQLPRSETRTYAVLGIIVVALVFTHYTSSVLVLLVLLLAWVLEKLVTFSVRRRRTRPRTAFVGLIVPVTIGASLYIVWYGAIPYVFTIIQKSLATPFEFAFAVLIGEIGLYGRGQSVAGALGGGNSLGYWSIRLSLVLLAIGILAGWLLSARNVRSGRSRDVQSRLFFIQTAAIGVMLLGFVAPTRLDSSRLFAFSLVLCASLVSWNFIVPKRFGGTARARAFVVATVVIASSQMGLIFLIVDGEPFSVNLGDTGPVYARYAFDSENVAIRAWALHVRDAGIVRVTPERMDFFHENPDIPIEFVRPFPDTRIFTRGDAIIDTRNLTSVCFTRESDAPHSPESVLVYDSGKALAFAQC